MKIPGTEALTNIKKLYRLFSKKQKRAFKWLVFFTFLGSASDLIGLSFIIPIIGLVLSQDFYNQLVASFPAISGMSKNNLLFVAVGLFFIVILVKNALGMVINRIQVNFVKDHYLSSSMNTLNKIYNKSYLEILHSVSAKLANKLSGMQIGLTNNATLSVITIINESMIFIITSVVLLLWNWQLFLLMLAIIIPVMGIFYARVKNTIKAAGAEKNGITSRLIAHSQEMLFGYADIKIAGTEESYKNKYRSMVERFAEHQGKINFINFLPTRILEIAIFLCIIVILLYCVIVLQDITKIVTTVSLFSVVAYRSIPSVNRFVVALTQLNAHEHMLDDPDFLPEDANTLPPPVSRLAFNKSIRFEDISFRYPGTGNDILVNCNLEVKRGEKIGIIGKSGSGKSTMINNILGFLYPTQGHILIDDTVLTRNNMQDWWELLGYVRQDVFILNNTFIENIVLGEPLENVNHDKLNRAIELASLKELVESWPLGVETLLGERGNILSGGQKQRVAIARAIYKGARVLIFDEATSSLDSETEEEITNAIRDLGHEDLTIIIIAHRYTSLRYCDKIYRLENGRLGNSISYEQLSVEMMTGI